MKYTADQLYEELFCLIQITCSSCDKTSTHCEIDEWDAAKMFFKEGWRKTRENCYCPECAKKKLKSL